jgi:hypothetical protein
VYDLRLTQLGPVSYMFATFAQHQATMISPATCGQVVPAWRDAVILHDPAGRAAELRRMAID